MSVHSTTRDGDDNAADHEPMRDVPGQQIIFPRFEGGIYGGDKRTAMEATADNALAWTMQAMGGAT